MKNTLIIWLFLLYTPVFSQSYTISGEIKDSQSNEDIPYVHIAIAGTTHGNTSNSEGKFRILVPEAYKDSLISFSCIGYETVKTPVDTLINLYNKVQLKRATLRLNNLVITNLSPQDLIKKCIVKIPDNYINYPVSVNGYYLSATKEDDKFCRLLETRVDIYNKNFIRYHTENFLDTVNNKSGVDYRTNKIREPSSVHASLSFDHVINGKGFLNPENLDSWKFELEGAFENDSVLFIKATFITTENKLDHKANIYIDQHSFAILKIEYDYRWNSKKLMFNSEGSPITAYHKWSGVFNYTRYSDRYFLKSFNYNVTQGIYDEFTLSLTALQEIRNELIINSVQPLAKENHLPYYFIQYHSPGVDNVANRTDAPIPSEVYLQMKKDIESLENDL